MDTYLVIIGDMIGSKELDADERDRVQQELQQVLKRINKSAGNLISPYTITLGDEFQAVYTRAGDVFGHLWEIQAELHPVRIRFSIAIGEITTSINKSQALGMDGPAFHLARKGIERLKKEERLFAIKVQKGEGTILRFMNNSLALLSGEVVTWNKNRLSILFMLAGGMDYKEITDKLGISKPAFYKNIEAASLDIVLNLCDDIEEILNKQLTHELPDIPGAAEPDPDIQA